MFTMILKTKKQKPKNTTGVFCVVCFGFWGVWGGEVGGGVVWVFFFPRSQEEFWVYDVFSKQAIIQYVFPQCHLEKSLPYSREISLLPMSIVRAHKLSATRFQSRRLFSWHEGTGSVQPETPEDLLALCTVPGDPGRSQQEPSSSRATGVSSSGKGFLRHLCLCKWLHTPSSTGLHLHFAWLQPSEKLLKTKTPIALSCIQCQWGIKTVKIWIKPKMWMQPDLTSEPMPAMIPPSNSKPSWSPNSPFPHHSSLVFFKQNIVYRIK